MADPIFLGLGRYRVRFESSTSVPKEPEQMNRSDTENQKHIRLLKEFRSAIKRYSKAKEKDRDEARSYINRNLVEVRALIEGARAHRLVTDCPHPETREPYFKNAD